MELPYPGQYNVVDWVWFLCRKMDRNSLEKVKKIDKLIRSRGHTFFVLHDKVQGRLEKNIPIFSGRQTQKVHRFHYDGVFVAVFEVKKLNLDPFKKVFPDTPQGKSDSEKYEKFRRSCYKEANCAYPCGKGFSITYFSLEQQEQKRYKDMIFQKYGHNVLYMITLSDTEMVVSFPSSCTVLWVCRRCNTEYNSDTRTRCFCRKK